MAQNEFDPVIIQGTTYLIPKEGTNPPWGEELNDYLKAIGIALSTVVGPADIVETSATIANNQAVAANVPGLSFDPAEVRGAFVEYTIYRSTDSAVKKETGLLTLLFDAAASIGNKWSFNRESDDDSAVILTVTDGGQVQYTSSNMAGTGYSGKITFRGRGILQA